MGITYNYFTTATFNSPRIFLFSRLTRGIENFLAYLLQKFSLKKDWAEELQKMIEKDKTETVQSSTAFVQEAKEKIKIITTKFQRLLDGYSEQDIEQEIYRVEKVKLLSEKKSLEKNINTFEQKRTG
ncbi:MAG: hypothetical protein ABIG88_03480 [Patescibacteria group bacterium]